MKKKNLLLLSLMILGMSLTSCGETGNNSSNTSKPSEDSNITEPSVAPTEVPTEVPSEKPSDVTTDLPTSAPTIPPVDKNSPIYTGMEIENIKPINHQLNKEKDDDDFESNIDDLVGIHVQTSDDVEYYVEQNEVFNIKINLYNPMQYEIMSFTLNGKKYSSYMFEEGSNMELLILKTTAPAKSGYVEYTIDAIKYIDGDDIKDVRMEGEKTIKAGVEYPTKPSIINENLIINSTSINYNFYIKDTYDVIVPESLSFYLTDGKEILYNKSLKSGYNEISYDNLQDTTSYEIGIISVYDNIDGLDLHSTWLKTQIFKTKPSIEFGSTNVDKTSITFNYNKLNELAEITNISLYKSSDNSLITSISGSENSFNDLLSDTEYDIEINYTYKIEQGTINNSVRLNKVKTLAYISPTLNVFNVEATRTSIGYNIAFNNADNIDISVDSVKLYENNKFFKELDKSFKSNISDLKSNTLYKVEVVYSYNLNNGKPIVKEAIDKEIRTLSYDEPLIDVSSKSTTDSLSYNIDYKDPDNLVTLGNIELYYSANDELVSSKQAIKGNNTFDKLYSNELYYGVLKYQVDLNDGSNTNRTLNLNPVLTDSKRDCYLNVSSTHDYDSYTYTIRVSDSDNISTIKSINLSNDKGYSNDLPIDLLNNTVKGLVFGNYTLTITYEEDRNLKGGSVTTNEITDTFTIEEEMIPVIELSSIEHTAHSISGYRGFYDPTEAIDHNSIKLSLYKGTEFIDSTTESDWVFNNLESSTTYKLVITYKYEINDGLGLQESTFEYCEVTTDFSYNVTSINTYADDVVFNDTPFYIEIACDLPHDDPQYSYTSVLLEINGIDRYIHMDYVSYSNGLLQIQVVAKSSYDMPYLCLVLDELKSGENIIKLKKLETSYTDYTNHIDIETKEVITGDFATTIDIARSCDIASYEMVNSLNESTNIFYNDELVILKFTLINDKKLKLLNVDFFTSNEDSESSYNSWNSEKGTLNIIDNSTFEISIEPHIECPTGNPEDGFYYGDGIKYFGIKSVTFETSSGQVTSTIPNFEITYNRTSGIKSNEVTEVSTAEELMNAKTSIVSLKNDIDLTGIETLGDFNGTIKGNGFKFKNYTYNKVINDPKGMGLLFREFIGKLENVTFSNINVDVTLKGNNYNRCSMFLLGYSRCTYLENVTIDETCNFKLTNSTTDMYNFLVMYPMSNLKNVTLKFTLEGGRYHATSSIQYLALDPRFCINQIVFKGDVYQ